MKYIVFGAGGFLGNRLVEFLRANQMEVIAASRKDNGDAVVDITSAASFNNLKNVDGADIIINCASVLPDVSYSLTDTGYLKNLFETNVIGAVNILNFAAAKGIKKIINCSTLSVINKPWPVPLLESDVAYPTGRHIGYSISKLSQELVMNEVAKNLEVALIHLRLAALYGPHMAWQGILPNLIEKAIIGENISLINASKTSFDFVHVDDLSKIIWQLSKMQSWDYQVVNIASGEEIYLKELADLILDITSSVSIIENKDSEVASSRAAVDLSRLKSMLGENWKMTPLEDGIKELVNVYRSKQ